MVPYGDGTETDGTDSVAVPLWLLPLAPVLWLLILPYIVLGILTGFLRDR